jgi:DNA-binding transcriptional ArsR family regulator
MEKYEPFSDIFVRSRSRMMDTELRAILFHGLADYSRLAILRELELGEQRVSDLVSLTGLMQSNVSKHLACLWECGLVERERRGREIYYRLVAGMFEPNSAGMVRLDEAESACFGRKMGRKFVSEQATEEQRQRSRFRPPT